MSRKANEQPLSEVVKDLLKAYGMEEQMNEMEIMKGWDIVMGKFVAKHTTDMWFKNKVLYIKLDSSVIKNELQLAKTQVIEKINDYVGKNIITDLKIY